MAMSSKPKSFTFYTKATWRRKLVTWSMLFLYLTQPILASAEVVADPKAPKANTPQVQTTANGLPVVQIAAPSASGVSRNLYQQFNVDPSGLILNNSQLITQTQLAGYITGNPNLANGSARIILNEVTSNNPSYLRGYTEVAGQKAEVIIANPNGIYGDGFGFINTSRAVLTTGTPVFGGSGSLDTFRVTGGQISIQGNGMNASNTDQVDIISRAVNVNASLYANQLNVVAGANQVNYNTLQAQPIAGDINTPQVQIDIGQLGGMYARKIYMVGTEKGVGVNSKGIISSIGDLAINSEGKVTLAQTSAGGNIAVTTKDQVTNQGSLYAQGSTTINSQGDFQNTGILASGQQTSLIAQNISSTGSLGAGITIDGKVGNTGDLILNANGTVTTHGQNIIAGDLSIQGTALDLSGSQTTAGSNISLTATQGNINNTGGSIQTRNVLTTSAQGTIHNDQDASGVQAQISAGQLNLAAANITNQNSQITQTGIGDTSIIVNNTLDNTVGQIETNGTNTTIQAAYIINSQGQIQHAGTGNLALQTISDLTNSSGKISTNGQVNFIAQNLDNTQGSITAQKQISVTSRVDVKNQHGTIMSADALNINAQGNVMNQQGDMEANKGLSITAQSFNNQSGRLVNLDGSKMKVNVSHNIQNQSGLLGGNGNVNIATQTLENQGGKITSQGNLTVNATNGIDSNLTEGQVLNNGAISSGGDLTLNSAGKVQLSGSTSANGKIQVNAQEGFANYGIVNGQNNTEINTQGALDNTGTILAGQHTTLTAQTVNSTGTVAVGVQDDGTLGNNGDLTVNAKGTVSLNGKNMAAGNLNVNGANLDLKNSKNIAGGAIKLTAAAGDIDHSSATLHTDKTVMAQAQGSIRNDKGNITAAQLTLTGGSISNRSGAMTQVGQGNTTITAANTIDNTSGTIATNGNAMEMQTASLINSQGQILHAGAGNLLVQASGDVRNDRGKLATNGQLTAAANTIDNTKGTVTGQQQVNLTTRADMINIQGTLTGSDTVNIKAQGAVNNQQGDIEASKGLSITAQSFNNQSGRLVNLDGSNMKVNVSHNIQNQSGLLGGNGNVNIATQTLENQGGKITSQGNLTVNATNGIDSNLTEGQVLNNGAISSGGDLTLNSTGKVRLSGNTSANGKIQVNAQSGFANYGIVSGQNNTEINTQGALDNTGTILAGQHTTLTAQTVNSTGTVAAGVQDDGTLGNNGDLTVNAEETVSLNGKNMAAGNITVNGATLDLKSSKNIAGGAIKLTAAAGDIDHSNATLHTDKTVTAEAQGSIRNDKGNITAAQLTLTGGSISNRSGAMTQVGQGNTTITAANTIDNTSGAIATNGNAMEMQTASLINSQGQILHAGAGNLLVQASGDVRNDRGKLATNGQLTAAANTIDNTKGTVTGQQQVNLTTWADMINIQGTLTGSDNVNIRARGAIDNQQGDIEAKKGLSITAQSFNNQSGRLVNLDGSNMKVNISHNIQNQSGLLGGNGNVNIVTQTLENQGGKITSQGNLAVNATNGIDSNLTEGQVLNNGAISSGGDLTLNSAGKVQLSGNTSANGKIQVNAQEGFANYGIVNGQNNTEINTQGALDNTGTILAGQHTTLTAQTVNSTGTVAVGVQDDGTLGNNGDLTVNAKGTVSLNGKNMAAGNLNVNGANLDLKNSKNIAGGAIKLTAAAGDIDHSNATLHTDKTVTAEAQGSIRNDKGNITAAQLTLTGGSISNRSGAMTQVGQGNTTITAANTIDNTSGAIATNGNAMEMQTASLINSQGQILHAGAGNLLVQASGDVRNDRGKLATNGQLTAAANTIDNTKGTVTGQQQVNLTTWADMINIQGTLTGSDTINIKAQGVVNNQQGDIEASKGLELVAQSLDNQNGRLASLDASGLNINIAHDVKNQSGLIGGNGKVNITTQNISNQSGKMIAQDNLTITATNGIDNTTDIAQVQKNGGITSGGDLIVNSEGKVLLSGNTTANGNIKINARGGLSNNSTMYAQGNTDISTQGTLENSSIIAAGQDTTLTVQNMTSTGTLIAGIQNDGILGSSGDLMINAGGIVTNHGQNMAASNLTVNGTSLDLGNGKIYAGGNANLTATTGDIDHSGGALQVGGVFNANAQGVIRNDNGTISTGKLALNANSISNRSGTMSQFGQEATTINAINTVDNTGGTLITNGDPLTIHAGSLINSQGQIQHAGNGTLFVQAKTDYKNANGKVATNGRLQLSAKNMDNTQGTILAKGVDLTANGTLKNSQGVIASSVDAIRINVQGNISNEQGSIEANKGLEVTGQSLDNQKGRIVSLDTSGLTITTVQDLQNQSGLIGGNGDIQLTASSFTNSLGQVIAQGSIHGDISQNIDNTNGNIKAQQGITLGQLSTNISNSMQGAISAGTNLAIKANAFDNTDGNLTAKQDIAIQAGDMTAGGTALAGQDVNLTVTNSFTQKAGGDLKANRDVTIVTDTFLNKGSISAVKDINLQMNKAINDSGSKLVGSEKLNVTATGDVVNLGMMAGNTTAIDAKNIANSGSIFTDKLTIKADTLSNTGDTAGITANQSAAFRVNTALHNINGATMYMGNKDTALTINTLALDNSGVIASRGNLAVEVQTIHSSGTLGAGVQSDGTLATDGDLVLQASDTVVATGKNLAAGTLAVTAQDINLTGAKTWACNDISLTAFTGDINNTGAVMQAKGAITLQAANALHNDKDAAGNAANIQGNAITIHANAMSNVGSNMTQFGSADTNITSATTLDNTGGSIVSNGTNLIIQTDTLTGSHSKIVHAGTGTLDVRATTGISNTNGSSIQTNGNVAIKAGNIDNTKGIVTALQGIDVAGNTLTNNQGTLAASKGVSITLQNGLKNQKGIVEAGKALTMNAQSIDNNGGSISSLDDSGMTINAVQNIDNTAGTIGSNGDVNLTARSIVNTTGKVLSQGSINANISQSINNTSGTIAARENVIIGKTGTNIVNATQGSITAGGTLVAQANTLSNTGGSMAANSDVTITAATVNGTGTVTAGQDVNLTVNGDFTYSADSNVKANRDVNLTASNVNNLGNMAAVRNLAIHTNNVMNHATLQGGNGLTIHATGSISNDGTMEGNTANINAQSITNTGSVFGDTITMTADAVSNNGKTAVIAATQNVNLYAKKSLENKDDATIYSMGNINIAGSKNQDANKEYIDKTGSVLNESATIEADGEISIYANTLTNKMREYEIKETVVSEERYDQEGVYQANDYYNSRSGNKNLYLIEYNKSSTTSPVVIGTDIRWYRSEKRIKENVIAFLLGQTTTETKLIPKSSIGKIMSGNNIKLRTDAIKNDMGWIIANGTLDTVGNLNNISVGNTRSTMRQLVRVEDLMWTYKSGPDAGDVLYHNPSYLRYFDIGDMPRDAAIGKMYYETTTEQVPGGPSSLFGGGEQVTIQGGSINNSTVAASSIPINTVNNITSSGSNIGTDTVKNNNTMRQTAAIQAVSGYNAVTSTSVPIGNFQTLLPKAQNQSVTSAQTSGNSSNQTTTMPVNTVANITSSTQNQSVASAQTSGNSSSQTTTIPVKTAGNITSSTQNQSVASAQTSGNSSSQTTTMPVSTAGNITSSTQNQSVASAQTNSIQAATVQTGSTTQTVLSSGKTPSVVEVKQTVDDSLFTLPTNGMFSTHQEPNSKYLVETNPRFTSYSNFISSDYMLQQLNFDPAKTMKRLGDGFYEQKIVREQVTDLTGRYMLNGYSSAEEQYKALMTNGAAYAKQFNLQVGVALTTEQMAQMTSNMVWMVEKEVDGQKVLVPEVYLARSGNIILKADGAVIAADNIEITSSGDVNNAGTIKASESLNIQAINIANYGGTIDGGKSTQLTASQNIVNFGGSINGGHTQLVAGEDVKNETISFTSTLPFMTKTTIGNVASINAGDSLTINANDTSIIGAELNAGQNVTINATGNFIVDSIEQDRLAAGKYLKDTVSNVVSNINAGNNVSITSTGDTILKGAQITAGNALDLTAGGNINITAVKDETIQDQTVGSSSNWKRTRTDDETVIGSTLQGGGKVTVKTTAKLSDETTVTDSENRGNITIAGSTIKSENDKVTISADKNVTIQEVTEKHESLVVTHKKKSGFLSSKTTDTMDHSLINEVKGSTISGNTVAITAGSDLTVQGSNVVGAKDVTLNATNDVNITSATETGADDHYSYTKKSGLFSGGGLGFTIGSQSTKTTTNERTLGEVGSTIGSINGDVSITAGEKVNSQGTSFVSGNDLSITGKDVTIDNTVDTYDSQTKYEFKQSGLSVSLGGGIVNTATSAYNNIERSGQVQDERLKALYDYKAFKDLEKINGQLSKGISKENLKKDVSVSVSIGSTKITSEQTVHTETVNTSNINADGDVTIKATEGDVNLKGTNINAENVTLDAAKNVNIGAAENKQQSTTNTSSSSWSVGGAIGSGFFGNVSKGSGKENENANTNTGSVIDANDILTIKSGADSNIIGSKVKGDTVVADIDGNLNIASKQDTDDYTAKNQNSGFGVSTGPKGGVTGSVSKGKTDSTYVSVTEQAGIYAGEGGFDINVGKNTDLKGAVIASDATPDKNKISTDTLTYSDIQNKAEYSASSTGVSLDTRKGTEKKDAGLTPNIGVPVSGDASSTTKSAVSLGTIEVRSNLNQDISNLSRDTTNSVNALGKIFDKKSVQEKQELSKLFGELAYEEVHKISDRAKDAAQKELDKAKADKNSTPEQLATLQEKVDSWDVGGSNKIALHALVGGIMSELGGSDFMSGAVGADFNQVVQKELKNRFENQPDMWQWASAIVGATATSIIGGDVQAGASTAASGTKNNDNAWSTYRDTQKMRKLEANTGETVRSLIDAGIIGDPRTMECDYAYFELSAGLGKFASAAGGFMVDKQGNVYAIVDGSAGVGIAPPITGTYGKGYVGNISEQDRTDLSNALEGLSVGSTSVAGAGGNVSVGSGFVLSAEVQASFGIGKSVGVRYAKKIFNIFP
jgi:filamentous hemagglutinin